MTLFFAAKSVLIGKTTINENGVTFAIYDRERTICDMFKHRGKVDNEMFSNAVNAYANELK